MNLCKNDITKFDEVTNLNHLFCINILTMMKEKGAIEEHIFEMTKEIN